MNAQRIGLVAAMVGLAACGRSRSDGAPERLLVRARDLRRRDGHLRPERHGRGPAQPADLPRRRGAHRRSGPRRDRAGRRQRPARGRRHLRPVRFALRAAGLGRRRLGDFAQGRIRPALGGRQRREGRAPHRHGGRDGLHESGRARARQRGSAPRLRRRRPRRLGRGARALRLLHRARGQLPARPRRGRARDRARQLLARPLRQLGGRSPPGHLRRAAQRLEPVRRRGLFERRRLARRLRQLGLQLDLLELRVAAARSPRAGRPTRTAPGTTRPPA